MSAVVKHNINELKKKARKKASQMTVNRGEYYQDYIENYAADVQAKNIQKKM